MIDHYRLLICSLLGESRAVESLMITAEEALAGANVFLYQDFNIRIFWL